MNRLTGKLALYLRLSQEDEDEGESGSIQNQRELLTSYIGASPQLAALPREEYVDDGCSGTSFDRPALHRLLHAVWRGEIACIAVKDFSRFGRNYVQVGDWLERIFPALGVRFLSVNDGYDSQSQPQGLDLAFKAVLHDLYSRDLSDKVRSARAVQMRQGKFTSRGAPFGYQKSAERRGRLEPDPAAAQTVQEIFVLAAQGWRTSQIAEQLNRRGVLSPAVYRGQAETGRWSKDAVTHVLRDERYTGCMVCGKRERLFRENATLKIPRAEWVKIPDTHAAIISAELFAKAQLCMRPLSERMSSTARKQTTAAYAAMPCLPEPEPSDGKRRETDALRRQAASYLSGKNKAR